MLEQTKRIIHFFARAYVYDCKWERDTVLIFIYLLFSCVANNTMWPVSGSMPKMRVKNRRTFHRFHRIEIFGLPFLCSSSTFVNLTLIKQFYNCKTCTFVFTLITHTQIHTVTHSLTYWLNNNKITTITQQQQWKKNNKNISLFCCYLFSLLAFLLYVKRFPLFSCLHVSLLSDFKL